MFQGFCHCHRDCLSTCLRVRVAPEMPRVFLGNLPSDCRVRDIEDFFREFGKVCNYSKNIQGVFFNWPPPKCIDWPPPRLSKCWNHIHFARHLDVFRSKGGPVWDSDVFFKSVTYRPTLGKFRGGPGKKNTLYKLHSSCDKMKIVLKLSVIINRL